MNTLITFDALIVYTETLAVSASDISMGLCPFPIGSRSETYNNVYGYFLEVCEKKNLSVAFTTSADIIGAGMCKSFWTYENKKWSRVNTPCYSELIFEKFSPVHKGIKKRREILFSSDKIKSFNNPELFGLFFDKQRTYSELSQHTIPTVSIDGYDLVSVRKACDDLTKLMSNHGGASDFSDEIVMKDRFGAGGRHIYKFKKGQPEKMWAMVRKHRRISFIIQPFAKFDQGFSYLNSSAATDIRLIHLNGKIVQYYIRVAKPGDFRCNEHQGGSLTYLNLKDLPKQLKNKSKLIAGVLDKKSFYALDFIITNSGNAYLLEGNTGPGLDWNEKLKKNELEAKKLIRLVVEELVERSKVLVDAGEKFPKVHYVPIISGAASLVAV